MSAHRGRNHGRSNDRCGVFSNDEKKRKNRVVGQVVDHSESVGVSRVTDGRTDDNSTNVLGIRLVRNQRTLVGTVACALRLGAPVVTVAVSKNAQTCLTH